MVDYTGSRKPSTQTCVFIAGTGTDIGKTYFSCALLRHWREAGAAPAVLKPVLSGFDPERLAESDTALLLRAAGREVNAANLDRASPWRFREAASPDIAAEAEGRTLTFGEVAEFSRGAIAAASGPLLIESAGGIMSPLCAGATMVDLAAALGVPAVLVAGSYLGSVSHTLSAVHVLESWKVPLAAVVVNARPVPDVPLEVTMDILRRHRPQLPLFGFSDEAGSIKCAAAVAELSRAEQ